MRGELTETSRDFTSFRIAKRVYINVDDDERRAREQIANSLVQIYGRNSAPHCCLWLSMVHRMRACALYAKSRRQAPS